MRFAVISNNKVVDVVIASEKYNGHWVESDVAQVGDVLVDDVFVTPTPPDQAIAAAAQIRSERNTKLAECDWTQLADSTADKQSWAVYRQALRDITLQTGFPWNVEWPTQP